MPAFRLLYNGLALLLLLPPLYLTFALPGEWLWRWEGIAAGFADGLAALAVVCFAFTTGSYDMGEFLGLRQWRDPERDALEEGPFRLSPLHRYVRHPWYFLGLVILWTRDMNGPLLLSALLITLYLIIGSRLEERKLRVAYGETYRRFQQSVPALFPTPFRYLTRRQAASLLDGADHEHAQGQR